MGVYNFPASALLAIFCMVPGIWYRVDGAFLATERSKNELQFVCWVSWIYADGWFARQERHNKGMFITKRVFQISLPFTGFNFNRESGGRGRLPEQMFHFSYRARTNSPRRPPGPMGYEWPSFSWRVIAHRPGRPRFCRQHDRVSAMFVLQSVNDRILKIQQYRAFIARLRTFWQ